MTSARRSPPQLSGLQSGPAIAASQSGVFTRSQARDEGWSDDQIRHRLRHGLWVPSIGRALTLAAHSGSGASAAWAAHLTIPDAVISHSTAGLVFGFPIAAEATSAHVLSRSHHRIPGIVSHRMPWADDERTWLGRLPVTTRARTALDCLSQLTPDAALSLWAWVSSRQILEVPELAAAVRQRFGWPGTPTLLAILMVARSGGASIAERKLHQRLRSAHIVGWVAGARIRDHAGRIIAVADVLFEAERLILEVDGYAAHSGPEAFVADRRRQNALVNAGYRVLRVTWADLIHRPAELIAEIRAALARP